MSFRETIIDEPDPTGVPPQLPLYHFHDAPLPSEPPCFVSCDEPFEQMELGLADAPLGAVDNVLAHPLSELLYPLQLQARLHAFTLYEWLLPSPG